MEKNTLNHAGIKGMKWGIRRFQNKDGSLTPAGRKRYANEPHNDYTKAHDKKSVKLMSDKELRERNNRLQMEKQYKDLSRKTISGKKMVQSYIATAGLMTAAIAATATYKRLADQGLDKIGDLVVKSINLSGSWTG